MNIFRPKDATFLMAAKRLELGLGVENEETRQVLNEFYKLRIELGYSMNVDCLGWLSKNAVESRSSEDRHHKVSTSRNIADDSDGPTSSKRKRIIIGPLKIIVLSSLDGSSERFGNEVFGASLCIQSTRSQFFEAQR